MKIEIMKINKILLVTLLLTSILFSCSKESLEELGVDPNNPTEANLGLLLTNAEADIAGAFGFNWDRYAGTFVQTFAGNHATGVSADRYLLTSSDFEGMFTARYRTGMKDAYEIINRGSQSEDWHHVGIAKIMMATALGVLTDVYGDIPYSEAFQGVSNPYPKYDTQEEIYNTIFDLLTTAITDLDKTAKSSVSSTVDIIFKGDLDKWKANANLLLARYNNHLSKRDPSGSATKALQYVDAAITAGYTSNNYNFDFDYDGSANWRNPWLRLYENNLIIASEKFMNMLKNTNDPRLRAYWDNKPYNYTPNGGVLGFVGKPNGNSTSADVYSPVGPQTFYGKDDSPLLIATYFELKFIEAEAAFRSGDKARAATALNDAVKSQIALVTPTVVSLINEEGGDLTAYTTSISNYENMYANETASTITLEDIMTEKYKAMFTMNVETWTDMRRHDYAYPSGGYISLPNEANLSDYIRRGLYPQSELDNNSAQVPKDITMLNRLWWDQ